MAVAAGVVIVAITNSSSDDLEEQSPDLESRCNGAEIYDPILAAAGVEGEVVGTVAAAGSDPAEEVNLKGSAVGCIPVCFYIEDAGGDEKISIEEVRFIREWSEYSDAKNFLRAVVPQGGGEEFAALFRNPTTLVHPLPGPNDADLPVDPYGPSLKDGQFASSPVDAAEVRVGPSQDDCFIYNSSGQIAEER